MVCSLKGVINNKNKRIIEEVVVEEEEEERWSYWKMELKIKNKDRAWMNEWIGIIIHLLLLKRVFTERKTVVEW